MKFEDIICDIGGFGRFQKMIVAISFISRFTLPCHFLLNNFIAAVPAHRCDVAALDDGGLFGNLSLADRLRVSIPLEEDGTRSSCRMFAEPQYDLLRNASGVNRVSALPCLHGWVYDDSTFRSTMTAEWDLVCDKRSRTQATATIFFVGVMFGALTFGSLSDRFGRRIMLLTSYLSGMLFALASALSTSYVMFAVLRFLTGFCMTGIVIVSVVLCTVTPDALMAFCVHLKCLFMHSLCAHVLLYNHCPGVEWVDIKHRKLVGIIDSFSWTFGSISFVAIAYLVTDWRWLIVSVTLPVILGIFTWRWMPESARWLIANGKVEEAHLCLIKCAKMNGTEELCQRFQPETLSSIIVAEKKGRVYSYWDLMRTPKMRRLSSCTGVLWCSVAIAFYGITFNITGFGLNAYLTQLLYSSVEVPGKLSIFFLLDRIGRKRTQVGMLTMLTLSLGINILIPKEMSTLRTVVAIMGKGFASGSFGTTVLYSSELFPTVVRQNGMGYNSSMARIGVALAPLILLLDDVWKKLPQVVLFSSAVLAVIVASLLPETRHRCLPETIEDIEGR
ncbi:LOW QUALITY PROTEIN: solute carrier family 22 member 7-like [Syngnathoides biaculeatus]|uniref:LOW QUALITY PROTEIN: solute carrier family 22 member 7-like n=1 Tax=Syngnathoides biaculeatus TaxID=300417 RepID=UPI002ADDCAD0|nr:LOW QUALITY PROTEIN: solute carrier family 22 member 7-like [Syngnathoides biaculeatus]